MQETNENEIQDRRKRFQSDNDEDEEGDGSVSGWGPQQLLKRTQQWVQHHRTKAMAIAAIMLVTGILGMVFWTYLVVLEKRRPTLEMAIRALDFGAYHEAREYAASVVKFAKKNEKEKRNSALYVLGVATCEQADQAWVSDKKPLYRIASDVLAESREGGFIEDRGTDGYFYLGKSFFLCEKYSDAITNLEIALQRDATQKKQIHWYLANCYYFAPKPNYQEALAHLNLFMTMPPFLERERQNALLLRILINVRLERLEEAKKDFADVPENTPFFIQRELAAGLICMREAANFRLRADTLEANPDLSVSEIEVEELRHQLKKTPFVEVEQEVLRRPKPASPFRQNEEQQRLIEDRENQRNSDLENNPDMERVLLYEPDPKDQSRVTIPIDQIQAMRISKRQILQVGYLQQDESDHQLHPDAVIDTPQDEEAFSNIDQGFEMQSSENLGTYNEENNPIQERNANAVREFGQDEEASLLKPTVIQEEQLQSTPSTNMESRQIEEWQEKEVISKDQIIDDWRKLADQKTKEAIQHFEQIKQRDTELLDWYRQAAFLEALCFERLGDFRRAQEEYYTIAKTFPDTSEAIASDFRWAYLEYVFGGNEAGGLAALEQTLDQLKNHPGYLNSWLSIPDMVAMATKSVRQLTESKQYLKGVTLLGYFGSIFSELEQSRLYTIAYSDWGKELLSESEQAHDIAQSEKLKKESQEKFREAGKWYKILSQWTYTEPEYLDNLWESATYYQQGRALPEAIEMYRTFLEHDIISRQAPAHYQLGVIYFELNEIETAIKELNFCIDNYPGNPVTEQARLTLSFAYQEKGDLNRAITLLDENLNDKLAPTAEVYRDSFFELGRLQLKSKQYIKGIETLEDAIAMYPEAKQTPEAHYLIANAYMDYGEKLKAETETATLANQQQIAAAELFESQKTALQHLKETRALLLQNEAKSGLSEAEKRMLRNAFFLIGRLLTAMGPAYYDESVQENRMTIVRYQNHPDVLQAYLQLARVYQLQNKTIEAQKILQQARYLLKAFQTNKAFLRETVYSEKQWIDMLK